MTGYKEIVTKAIIGKNRKNIKSDYEFVCNATWHNGME